MALLESCCNEKIKNSKEAILKEYIYFFGYIFSFYVHFVNVVSTKKWFSREKKSCLIHGD